DATDREGHIELSVALRAGGVEVAVQDKGHGIAPEHVNRLFQPYFTTKKHGTGLGLFVTRKLVADHGGTVHFESRPGQGTVFRVWLPIAGVEERRLKGEQAIPQTALERGIATAEGG